MKKVLSTLAVFGAAGAALAADSSSGITVDMSGLTSALTDWVASFSPTLVTVAVAFFAIFCLKLAIRAIKGVSRSAA